MPIKSDLGHVLLQHVSRYPRMEIQDLVKLIYQHVCGGGHLVTDEAAALDYLQSECRAIALSAACDATHQAADLPLYEPIGNGLCRLNLALLPGSGLTLPTVTRQFISTARRYTCDIEALEQALAVLRQVADAGLPLAKPITLQDLNHWLAGYRSQNYPLLSHSEVYRQAYHPAYRVVSSLYAHFSDLITWISRRMEHGPHPFMVAVDGNSGAGKSTLAASLAEIFPCNVFHMDHFFLRPEQRTAARLFETGGNVDYERFQAEVIAGLLSGAPFSYRPYDCQRQVLGDAVHVTPRPFSLIEGVYSLHPLLRSAYDLKVFLRIRPDLQRQRILSRSGPEMLQRFETEWIPREDAYFAGMGIASLSDMVFDAWHAVE